LHKLKRRQPSVSGEELFGHDLRPWAEKSAFVDLYEQGTALSEAGFDIERAKLGIDTSNLVDNLAD